MTRNQHFTVATVFDPIQSVRRLHIQNRAHGKLVQGHSTFDFGLADGAIDRVIKVRMRPERLG